MAWMSSNELRKAFLDYFIQHNHQLVPSASLIPANDPTLLFTNAGMVPFKDVFLGLEQRPYSRATSAQRCVRAGGKHNDLENVGFTKRHHTFFEMLGNFSFGDYFKKEAIQFAWDFLTKVLAIPAEKLWITVFKDDKESEAIWLKDIGVDATRFSRCGEKDNFWSMGDTGPCGPCTEIFYDHGDSIAGGPPGSPDEDGDRYVEIWNLVFMQFDRDMHGKLHPLPKPCVDTGMGLERIATVIQGVHDNYDIDIFQELLKALAKIVGVDDFQNKSMRVIVDHIRSSTFLMMDGVMPSNEGRGYVLRRIIRRALRHGYKLGMSEPFFYKLVATLVNIMGDAYPELKKSQSLIEELLKKEEVQFLRTLENGLKILDEAIEALDSDVIPGDVVFQLYDTYGFPKDLTQDIAQERNLEIDHEGFDEAMQRQRRQSQQHQQFSVDHTQRMHITGETEFLGYEVLDADAVVTTILESNGPLNALKEGQAAAVVLDKTPFYAESGGQIGDRGYLNFTGGRFRIDDTKKLGNTYLHYGVLESGELKVNDAVQAIVNRERAAIKANHSATHLLHEVMRQVLGEHVEQKGSLVEARRLRFDFSHPKPLTQAEINEIEDRVNQLIRDNLPAVTTVMSLDDAKAAGAMALFGEKYADEVRTVKMGEFSFEICGGTHVNRTGDIGLFKITFETGVASGIRRLEAVTGNEAVKWVQQQLQYIRDAADILKTEHDRLKPRAKQVMEQIKQLTKEKTQLQQRIAAQQTSGIDAAIVKQGDLHVLAKDLGDVDRDTLRKTVDQLRSKYQPSAIVLTAVQKGSVQLIAAVSDTCFAHFTAPDLLQHVAKQIDGKGGGRKDLAQGGGTQPEKLADALASVSEWIVAKMQA